MLNNAAAVSNDVQKTKAQLKAERREKQETQRAAKSAKGKGHMVALSQKSKVAVASKDLDVQSSRVVETSIAKTGSLLEKSESDHPTGPPSTAGGSSTSGGTRSKEDYTRGAVVLPARESTSVDQAEVTSEGIRVDNPSVHPAFISLGLQCSQKTLEGSDAIFLIFIRAFQQGAQELVAWLEDFVEEKLDLAYRAISLFTRDKLKSHSTVLTYSWCPIVEKVLLDAHANHVDFRVLAVDSIPERRGLALTRNLLRHGVDVSYALISALQYVIRECQLVLLGAEALLANGSMLGTVGSSQVALVARSHNVPVLVVCPTYKFVDKVQTGSQFSMAKTVLGPEATEVTPGELISGVITELRLLPPSSAPAVVRVKQVL